MSKIREINSSLISKKFSVQELLAETLANMAEADSRLGFLVNETSEFAAQQTAAISDSSPTEDNLLFGIPTAIKDNFNLKDTVTSASAKMLQNYVSPYSATAIQKLIDKKAVIVGKTNMDAFAHGSSTATSDFHVTKNPVNPAYYPGGSSGGSAAIVAAGVVPYAIGSETAGSIRQPAAWCGVVGAAPTYGRVSRYGLIAMGSSLDRPGPIATSVEDCAIVLDAICGVDIKDATSVDKGTANFAAQLNPQVSGLTVGMPRQYWDSRIDSEVSAQCLAAVKQLESMGVKVVEIDLLDPKYSIAVYTIVCRSEVSSNLARLDGIRYGYQSAQQAEQILDQIAKNRQEAFGREAKQRIMTGTYTLSAGYYDAYYKKAQQVRSMIQNDLRNALQNVDLIIAPTTPTAALKIGDPAVNDPLFGELSDVLVEASALSGLPSISLPVGKNSEGLPVGIQFIADLWQEQTMFNAALALEKSLL